MKRNDEKKQSGRNRWLLPLVLAGCVGLGATEAHAAPSVVWSKCFGGSGGENYSSMSQTNDKGIVFVGNVIADNAGVYTQTGGDGDVAGFHGAFDVWIVKTDSSGAKKWQKSLGGTGYEWFPRVCATKDGGFIVVCSRNGTIDGDVGANLVKSLWVVKYDKENKVQWQKDFGGLNGIHVHAGNIIETKDSGYLVCADVWEDFPGNIGGYDFYVAKIDAGGGVLWEKSWGTNRDEKIITVMESLGGEIFIVGEKSVSGGYKPYVAKISKENLLVWEMEDIEISKSAMSTAKIVSYKDNLIAVFSNAKCGEEDKKTIISYIKNDGNIILRKIFKKEYLYATNIKIDDFSDAIILTGGRFVGNLSDAIVIKLDENFNEIGNLVFGGISSDIAEDVLQLNDNNFLLIGNTESVGFFDGFHGDVDIWLAKVAFDSSGPIVSPTKTPTVTPPVSVTLTPTPTGPLPTGPISTAPSQGPGGGGGGGGCNVGFASALLLLSAPLMFARKR